MIGVKQLLIADDAPKRFLARIAKVLAALRLRDSHATRNAAIARHFLLVGFTHRYLAFCRSAVAGADLGMRRQGPRTPHSSLRISLRIHRIWEDIYGVTLTVRPWPLG
jgi:hypothetical protein